MTTPNRINAQSGSPLRRLPLLVFLIAFIATAASSAATTAPELATLQVRATAGNESSAYDGVVEAVRQTVLSAQVAGAVVHIDAKVGDRVKAGQVLLRIDARAADQNVAASDAQVQAARASLDVAAKDFERQKQLFQKAYISQAALERAESQFKATQAQVNAQLAQAGVARTQTGFNIVRAPYSGVIAEVPVTLGDMAMPGRPLMTIYDPAALRVTGAVPQTAVAQMPTNPQTRAEIPGLVGAAASVTPTQVQVLPTVDASTHTVQVRLELPTGLSGVTPGMFARLRLPTATGAASSLSVPVTAVVRRAEMTGLYVLDSNGRPLLRQVRLGRVGADGVEILAGLAAGERIALDPQAAARVR
jgi:RND family efflux transporter MFP subunit